MDVRPPDNDQSTAADEEISRALKTHPQAVWKNPSAKPDLVRTLKKPKE